MKSVATGSFGYTRHFPKLMVSPAKTVVLFNSERVGTVVYHCEGSGHQLGDHNKDWCMSNFTDYLGVVTLEND